MLNEVAGLVEVFEPLAPQRRDLKVDDEAIEAHRKRRVVLDGDPLAAHAQPDRELAYPVDRDHRQMHAWIGAIARTATRLRSEDAQPAQPLGVGWIQRL